MHELNQFYKAISETIWSATCKTISEYFDFLFHINGSAPQMIH